ncbi:MAG: hypothetical protein QXH13_04565, partial [Thermoplasmata archaeon]
MEGCKSPFNQCQRKNAIFAGLEDPVPSTRAERKRRSESRRTYNKIFNKKTSTIQNYKYYVVHCIWGEKMIKKNDVKKILD